MQREYHYTDYSSGGQESDMSADRLAAKVFSEGKAKLSPRAASLLDAVTATTTTSSRAERLQDRDL